MADIGDSCGSLEILGEVTPIPRWKPHHGDPFNFAYVCPTCGSLWARGHSPVKHKWFILTLACPACPGTYFTIPGSIWQDGNRDFNKLLPLPLLLREFELIVAHINQHGV